MLNSFSKEFKLTIFSYLIRFVFVSTHFVRAAELFPKDNIKLPVHQAGLVLVLVMVPGAYTCNKLIMLTSLDHFMKVLF